MAKRDFGKSRNASKVNDIINSSNMSGNAATAVDLDISKIDENPDNEKIFDMSGVEILMREIQEFGFTGAIDVYQKEDGRYELSAGHRRYRAMKALGRKTIPAIIKPMPSEIVRRHMLIHSNTTNRVLSYMDLANAIRYERATYTIELANEKGVEYSMDEHGDVEADVEQKIVMQKLSDTFNMSVSQVYRFIKLTGINKGIVDLLEQKRLPMECITLLPAIKDEGDEKNKAIQEAIYNAFASELSHANFGSKDLSTLSMNQCSIIAKSIINNMTQDGSTDEVKKQQVKEPTAIDFMENIGDEGEARSLFDSPGSQPQTISFSQIMNSGNEKKEAEDTESEEQEINSTESPSDRVRRMLEADHQEIRNSSTEKEETEAKPTQVYHNYIDNMINVFTGQMSLFIQNDFDIQDKEILSDSIEKLEEILKTIKEKL